ncbi:MAG: transketolase [Proteobacteria bacterium SG_bin7]|nr:MAG: transketolase [Proteobacteria bacterium SG_bin7]
MIEPIHIKNKLATTPQNHPKYWVEVSLRNGTRLKIADPRSTRAMVALMDMEAVLGGAASHWGGPAAFAELMSAVHGFVFYQAQKENVEWHDRFHLVNDAGHCENGLYALKANYGFADLKIEDLKKFRSIESKLSGHGEAHLFPEGVFISNGPLGSAFPQAQGLASADYLAAKNRITICAVSDGATFEGEAKEAFAAIPGFAAKKKLAPFIAVISDNNTKLSGRIDTDSFSMNPQFVALKSLGWRVIPVGNGHDLLACVAAVEQAVSYVMDDPTVPVCIHAKTIKGYGVEKTMKSASGGHGFPLSDPKDLNDFLKEIYGDKDVPEEFLAWAKEIQDKHAAKSTKSSSPTNTVSEKVQNGVSKALIDKKKAGYPIISVTSDLPGSTGVAGFHKEFPESSLDVGVAESNMVSVGIGLSKSGYIPIVDTFAQFGVTKGALPMILSALSEGPLIAIYSHVGFQDAADGASHQALSYFSMTASIPHTDVYNLSSSEEAYALVSQALDKFYSDRKQGKTPRSSIFFLGRENFLSRYVDANYRYALGKAQIAFDNSKEFKNNVTIVAAGAMLPQALKAAETLKADKIGAIVINPSIINRPDTETIIQCLEKTGGKMLTVEDHQDIGGMGALVTHAVLRAGFKNLSLISLGVNDTFGQSAYKADQLYARNGIDAKAIAQSALQLF